MASDSRTRREWREPAPASVRIMWQDGRGNEKFAIVKARDVSESGMRVELPEPVGIRRFVTLQCAALGLQGTASVRHCTRQGNRYVVGLAFEGGMKWKPRQEPKAAAVQETVAV